MTLMKFVLCAFAYAFPTAVALSQEPACTARDLSGAYGFTLQGQNVGLKVSYLLTGLFQADGASAFVGSGQQSVGGQPSAAKFLGTYEVKPDCTGVAKLSFPNGVQALLYFVLVEGGEELYLLDSGTGVLENGSAKRIRRGK